MVTRALFYTGPRMAELREVPSLPMTSACDVRVRTLWSGISRGTERLVFEGRVPPSEHERMQAPYQEGAFPFPVKYGYSGVGVVEEGPQKLVKKHVFCLFPHQDRFVVPANMVHVLPDNLPPRRAILAANMGDRFKCRLGLGGGGRVIGLPLSAAVFLDH